MMKVLANHSQRPDNRFAPLHLRCVKNADQTTLASMRAVLDRGI